MQVSSRLLSFPSVPGPELDGGHIFREETPGWRKDVVFPLFYPIFTLIEHVIIGRVRDVCDLQEILNPWMLY